MPVLFNLLLSLFLLTISCSTSKRNAVTDCSLVKKGKFDYRNSVLGGRISIVRDDSVQVETDGSTGMIARLRIEWPSSCEYKLTFLSFGSQEANDLFRDIEKPVIHSRIIKITPNYYVAQSTVNGKTDTQLDTILIMR